MQQRLGIGAVLVLATAALAGSPAGGLIDDCVTDLQLIEDTFNTRAQAIVAAAEAKLSQLDERGATDQRLTVEASKCVERITRLELDCYKVANKATRRCFVRLIGLDEAGLVGQLIDVDTARDQTFLDIGIASDDFQDAISGALASEIGD